MTVLEVPGSTRRSGTVSGPSDESGNLILSALPVVAPGARDTAIVVGPEGVLVLPFDREKELRGAVARLRGKPERA